MPKLRYQLPIALLTALILFSAWGATSAEATPNTCALYQNDQFSPPTNAEALDCAITIATSSQRIEDIAYGKWGRSWLAVKADGETYYNQGRGWVYWQTLDIPTAPAQPEAPIAGDADRDGIADEVDACVSSAENYNNIFDNDGCPDDLFDLLNFASDDLNTFWQAEFDEANLTYRPPNRVQAYTSRSRRSRDYNAYYTAYTHSIYFDTRLMTDALNNLGDVAPIFILAHEFGHLVQSQLGLLNNGRLSITTELEADCLAGAYLQNLDERGLLESGDAAEAMRQAYNVGDHLPAEQNGAHGSPTQRANAFSHGYAQGADSCFE